MSKVCPECLQKVEDDSRKFCPYCGEPLDPRLKMMKQMDTIVKEYKSNEKGVVPPPKAPERPKPQPQRSHTIEEEYIAPSSKPKKKSSSPVGIIVVILIVVCIAAYFLFLKK